MSIHIYKEHLKSTITSIGVNEEYSNMNKKSILKFGIIIIIGVFVASAAMSTGVLADAPTDSEYIDILNTTDGDGTSSNPHVVTTLDELQAVQVDILPALKREDSHGTVPLGWDIVVYDVTCS